MANQPVKFRKGVSTSLPKTPTNETIGAFLLETDTGNLYVDNSSTNRIQIKDNTKLPLSGGTLTGPINFNTDSLPQKTLQYVTGIDGFALALSNFNVTGLKCSGLTSSAGLILANTKYVRGISADGNNTSDMLGINGSNVCNVAVKDGTTTIQGKTVKLQSGSVVSSDKNLKKDFVKLDDNYDKFFDNLNPLGFKYIMGSSDRTHCGFIAQEVENSLINSGLTTKDFAGIVVNDISNYVRETTEDKDGNIIDVPNSEINYLLDKNIDKEYNLRYEEFIAIAIDQIQKLKKRVDILEKDNEELRHKFDKE